MAAARLAEGFLRTQLAVATSVLLSRNLPHLVRLRDEPGALLSPERAGDRRAAVGLAAAAGRPARAPVTGCSLARGDEGLLEPLAEGWLLRLPRARARTAAGAHAGVPG